MRIDKYRKTWLRAHKAYEKRAYSILKKYFRNIGNNIPLQYIDKDNYESIVDNSVKIFGLYDAYFELYNQIGLVHGQRVGRSINKEIKEFNPILFQSEFQRNLFNWVIENIGYRIVSVRQEYVKYIQVLILKGFNEGKTVEQISSEIKKLINSRTFYRWQSLRIARTETAAAANRAATIAGYTSGIALQKIWISGLDNRTRRTPPSKFDHYQMNGKKVDQDDYFNVNDELLEYPAAPITKDKERSSGANVINCRCTTALIPKRDRNGRIIRT